MGTLESLNVSQEIFFDATSELPSKESKSHKAKSKISQWRNSVSIEELNLSEKESKFCEKEKLKSTATVELIPMQSKFVKAIQPEEKEDSFERVPNLKEKSDYSLIFQHSKNITEVLMSNKEGKLRTIKPNKASVQPKISTKEAVLVKQVSLDDKLENLKIDIRKPACVNQDLVENCSVQIEQTQRLELEDLHKKLQKKLTNAKTNLSDSQLYLASIKDEKTNENAVNFVKSVDEKQAKIEQLSSLSHLTLNIEIKTNEKEEQFNTETVNLKNAKIDHSLKKDLELEITQPIGLEKEIINEKLKLDLKTVSISQEKLNELHISDWRPNEKEIELKSQKPVSTKVLPFAQAEQYSNYDQKLTIAQSDECKAQG